MEKLTEEDKQQKIVDAVNYFRGDLNYWFPKSNVKFVYCANEVGYFTGEIEEANFKLACTIKEFNQCVEEMSHLNGESDLLLEIYQAANKEKLEPEQKHLEWRNGDECFVDGYAKPIYRFIGKDPENCDWCWIAVEAHGKNVLIEDLSKPESLEQKAARERKEKIESLLDCWPHSVLSATLSEFAARLVDAGVKLPEQQ